MDLYVFLDQLNQAPERIEFSDVMAVVERYFYYTPVAFVNGELTNRAGHNEGSCKIFAFGKIMGFTQAQTLNCFGQFYRQDVAQHPEGDDHQNIRQFIEHGWAAVEFPQGLPLVRR